MLVTLALVFQTQTLQILGVQKGLKVLKYQENIFNILLRKHHIRIYTFVYIECVWLHSNRSVCVWLQWWDYVHPPASPVQPRCFPCVEGSEQWAVRSTYPTWLPPNTWGNTPAHSHVLLPDCELWLPWVQTMCLQYGQDSSLQPKCLPAGGGGA